MKPFDPDDPEHLFTSACNYFTELEIGAVLTAIKVGGMKEGMLAAIGFEVAMRMAHAYPERFLAMVKWHIARGSTELLDEAPDRILMGLGITEDAESERSH